MSSWGKETNELIAQGQYARAAKALEGRLEEEPRSVPLRQALAEVLVRDGQSKRAVGILEELVKEHIAEGFVTKAIALLKKIQQIDPAQSDAELMINTLLEMQQKEPQAEPRESPPAAVPRDEIPAGLYATSEVKLTDVWLEEMAYRRDDFSLSPLFNDLSKSELTALVGGLRVLLKQPGSIIYTEGEPGDRTYILVSGFARVYQRDRNGHDNQVKVLREGEVFGTSSVLSGGPRSSTITAMTECELLELDRETFEDIVGSFPRVRELMQELNTNRPT